MRKMRRKIAVLLVFVLAFTMMPQNVLAAKKKVKLSKKSVTVTVGKTVKVKMKNNKKKIAVLSIMTVLLVVSAVLNVWLNTKLTKRQETLTTNTNEPTVTETFKSFRSSRETTRQELIDYLDAIISSESASASAKTAAETQKQSVCTQMENELLLERLIQARGFRDVIVTLSDKNCTVVVADDNLEAQEVAQILSVVTNETSYTANDVIVCQY